MKRFARFLLNLFFLCITSFIFAQEPHFNRNAGFDELNLNSSSLEGGGFGMEVETEDAEFSLGYGGLFFDYE